MLRFPRISSIFVSQNPVNVLACSVFVIGFLFATRTNAQVVATYSFEDGTADGWTSFNGATAPVATNAASHSGSYSLQTTTGASGQGGPSINVGGLLQAGAKYTITGYVRLRRAAKPQRMRTSPSSAVIRVARAGRASTRSGRTRFR